MNMCSAIIKMSPDEQFWHFTLKIISDPEVISRKMSECRVLDL